MIYRLASEKSIFLPVVATELVLHGVSAIVGDRRKSRHINVVYRNQRSFGNMQTKLLLP